MEKAKRGTVSRPCSEVSPNLLSKSNKTMPVSTDLPDPKPVKGLERKSPSKAAPLHEVVVVSFLLFLSYYCKICSFSSKVVSFILDKVKVIY